MRAKSIIALTGTAFFIADVSCVFGLVRAFQGHVTFGLSTIALGMLLGFAALIMFKLELKAAEQRRMSQGVR